MDGLLDGSRTDVVIRPERSRKLSIFAAGKRLRSDVGVAGIRGIPVHGTGPGSAKGERDAQPAKFGSHLSDHGHVVRRLCVHFGDLREYGLPERAENHLPPIRLNYPLVRVRMTHAKTGLVQALRAHAIGVEHDRATSVPAASDDNIRPGRVGLLATCR